MAGPVSAAIPVKHCTHVMLSNDETITSSGVIMLSYNIIMCNTYTTIL